jgi:lysophospholipase L1-like esterase
VHIAQKLREKYPNVVVMNPSTNGFTTRQAIDRMSYELSKIKIDIMIIQYGMNDCNYWETDKGIPRVSPEVFEASLVEMANRASLFGAKIVFFMVSQPSGRDVSELKYAGGRTYQQCLDSYNNIIRRVSQKHFGFGIGLIDMDKYFKKVTGGNRAKLLPLLMPEPDLIHLSPKGHDIYVEYVFPILDDMVERLEYQKRISP